MESSVFDRVMRLCEEKGISQRELGRMSNISFGTISKWKTQTPRIDTLQKVADYFKVDVNYLLGNTPYQNQQEMLADWDNKNPENEMTLPDGTIVDFDTDNTVTFHSTGGSITYTNYDSETKQIAEAIASDKKLKELFHILEDIPGSKFDAVYNIVKAMNEE